MGRSARMHTSHFTIVDSRNCFISIFQQQLITDAELNGADIYIPVSFDVNLWI